MPAVKSSLVHPRSAHEPLAAEEQTGEAGRGHGDVHDHSRCIPVLWIPFLPFRAGSAFALDEPVHKDHDGQDHHRSEHQVVAAREERDERQRAGGE